MAKRGESNTHNLMNRRRQEKQLDDLLRLTKDTNKMLRSERNARKIKMIVVLIVLLGVTGYGYYLFEKHKIKIIEFQQKVEELQNHLQEAGKLVGKVGETADSIRTIFEEVDPNTSDTDTEE